MSGLKEIIATMIKEQLEQRQLDESSLSRLYRKSQEHVCGAISGYRADNSKAENKKNNREILTYLQGKGYSVTSVKGSYIENYGTDSAKEVSEPSFFVCNQKVEGDDKGQLQKDLAKLGRKFDQDSVLVIPVGGKGAYLYGTSKRDNAFPEYNKKVVVGNSKFGKAAGEFLSRIGGREFAFEDVAPPATINGIRGQKMFAEKMDKEMGDE